MVRSLVFGMAACTIVGMSACTGSDFSGGSKSATSATGADGFGDSAGADGSLGVGSKDEQFIVQDVVSSVDVVIAIDTSGSMTDESTYLQNNIATFLTDLQASKIDAKVIVVASPFTSTQPPDKVQVINQRISSHDAIGALNRQFALNTLALRGKNPLEIVFVTDDNGEGLGNLALDFRPPTDRRVVVNGILGLKEGLDAANPACDIPNVGAEYITLAKGSKGSIFDLCMKDWNPLLKKLGDGIIQRTRGFTLASPASPEKGFSVRVGTTQVPPQKYTYDAGSNSITIAPDVDLKAGDKITISYYPQP